MFYSCPETRDDLVVQVDMYNRVGHKKKEGVLIGTGSISVKEMLSGSSVDEFRKCNLKLSLVFYFVFCVFILLCFMYLFMFYVLCSSFPISQHKRLKSSMYATNKEEKIKCKLKLQTFKHLDNNPAAKYGRVCEVIPARLKTGDLLFFDSAYFRARTTKLITKCRWDHVGMVVVIYGRLYILEATYPKGVDMYILENQLEGFFFFFFGFCCCFFIWFLFLFFYWFLFLIFIFCFCFCFCLLEGLHYLVLHYVTLFYVLCVTFFV